MSNTEVAGVQSLYTGRNHNASWERSYNADGQVYTSINTLSAAWQEFLHESQLKNRRRAVMRCYVSKKLLPNIKHLPVEAAVPVGQEYLIWLGENRHPFISTSRNAYHLPAATQIDMPNSFYTDTQLQTSDATNIYHLWRQFGWSQESVTNFIQYNTNPLVVIRNMEQQVIGIMIAEAADFGHKLLVEMTELAVNPAYRGQHLASVLIKELAQLSLSHWHLPVVFGEYNQTTKSYSSAAKAGQIAAQVGQVNGILRDHVGIETGAGNQDIHPWSTRWLHNFLVMYQENQVTLG